jgi:hypothetical protein
MNYYAMRPDEEKEKGLMQLAPTPPIEDEGVVARLWDRWYRNKSWRKARPSKSADKRSEAEIVAHINSLKSAPTVTRLEMRKFDVTKPDFVRMERRVSKRRGNWWVLPKDLKG